MSMFLIMKLIASPVHERSKQAKSSASMPRTCKRLAVLHAPCSTYRQSSLHIRSNKEIAASGAPCGRTQQLPLVEL